MSAGTWGSTPNTLVGGAYSPVDLQALRVSDAGTVRLAPSDRYSLDATALTFRPYRYGQSDPRLRPAV